MALVFPDLASNLLSTVSISAALYPLLNENPSSISLIFNSFVKIFLKLGGLLFLVLSIYVFFRFPTEKYYIPTLIISLVSIFPNVVTAISSAFLNFFYKTKAQALSTVIFNTVLIIGLLITKNLFWLAIFILSAAILRMFFLFISYTRFSKIQVTSTVNTAVNNLSFSTKKIILPLAIASFSQVLMLINPFLDRLSLAYGTAGKIAILSYAEKLSMLPVTIFLTIAPYVMTPEIFKLARNKNDDSLQYASKPLLILFLAGTICMLGILLFANQLVNLILAPTGIPQYSLTEISSCLISYSLMLPFVGPLNIMTTIFLANNLSKSLCLLALMSLVLKLSLVAFCTNFYCGPQYISLTTSVSVGFFATICFFSLYIHKKNYYGVYNNRK